jgi:hypothetical protein
MKSPLPNTCLLAALSAISAHAENLVKDGGFEPGDELAFYKTQPWHNRVKGLNQGHNARSVADTLISGTYSATVVDRKGAGQNEFGPLAYAPQTKHAIRAGESFLISYDWCPRDEYWQRHADTVRFVLYATVEDPMGGPLVNDKQKP